MNSKIVAKVGSVLIGGNNPIVIQTMCNTHTADIDASVAQCERMYHAGAQLIRLTVQGMNEVRAIEKIRTQLRERGIDTPLVADIHFRSDVALEAAKVVEKVRVNPGNFNKDHSKACADFATLLDICKEHGTAIRIGVNHGSLGERITSQYGNTPEGMARAAMEWLEMCIAQDFFNVVVSLKASNVLVMVQAYRILQQMMSERGHIFPTHLGVTEAGNGDAARIKSAAGVGTLLSEGIGDTIRVSLTEDPVAELPVARRIADYYRDGAALTASELESGSKSYATQDWEQLMVEVACDWAKPLIDRRVDGVTVHSGFGAERDAYLVDELMQACRRKFYRPEYIGCPGCGRTMFDLEETFNKVKAATGHLQPFAICSK